MVESSQHITTRCQCGPRNNGVVQSNFQSWKNFRKLYWLKTALISLCSFQPGRTRLLISPLHFFFCRRTQIFGELVQQADDHIMFSQKKHFLSALQRVGKICFKMSAFIQDSRDVTFSLSCSHKRASARTCAATLHVSFWTGLLNC